MPLALLSFIVLGAATFFTNFWYALLLSNLFFVIGYWIMKKLNKDKDIYIDIGEVLNNVIDKETIRELQARQREGERQEEDIHTITKPRRIQEPTERKENITPSQR